jgi:hypothetical protein
MDLTPPVSSASSSMACDMRRATRPLPSRKGESGEPVMRGREDTMASVAPLLIRPGEVLESAAPPRG